MNDARLVSWSITPQVTWTLDYPTINNMKIERSFILSYLGPLMHLRYRNGPCRSRAKSISNSKAEIYIVIGWHVDIQARKSITDKKKIAVHITRRVNSCLLPRLNIPWLRSSLIYLLNQSLGNQDFIKFDEKDKVT